MTFLLYTFSSASSDAKDALMETVKECYNEDSTGGQDMKIFVGSVAKTEEIKNAILNMEEISFTYEGKRGLNMVFACEETDEKATLRKVKDMLKGLPELGGLFYNVSVGF